MGVSYTVIRDRYIPDPSSIFGTGTVNPFSSSASVTRSYKQSLSADSDAELPITRVDVQGQVFEYKSAGFTYVSGVDEEQIEDYYSVFGQSNVFAQQKDGSYGAVNDDDVAKTCSYYGYYDCALWSYNSIRILDYCAGTLYDYGSCYQQCRDMDGYSGITAHGKPSYCGGLKDQDLLAQSYTQSTQENNKLAVSTRKGGVSTTDTFNWGTTTTRTVQPQNAGSQAVSTTVGENRTSTW
jgi:hypothetical protein